MYLSRILAGPMGCLAGLIFSQSVEFLLSNSGGGGGGGGGEGGGRGVSVVKLDARLVVKPHSKPMFSRFV